MFTAPVFQRFCWIVRMVGKPARPQWCTGLCFADLLSVAACSYGGPCERVRSIINLLVLLRGLVSASW